MTLVTRDLAITAPSLLWHLQCRFCIVLVIVGTCTVDCAIVAASATVTNFESESNNNQIH
jgi:hypothetical protein